MRDCVKLFITFLVFYVAALPLYYFLGDTMGISSKVVTLVYMGVVCGGIIVTSAYCNTKNLNVERLSKNELRELKLKKVMRSSFFHKLWDRFSWYTFTSYCCTGIYAFLITSCFIPIDMGSYFLTNIIANIILTFLSPFLKLRKKSAI